MILECRHRQEGCMDVVVVGGGPWSPDTNFPTHHTARLLSREHRVLYLCRDTHVSLLGQAAGRLRGFHTWTELAGHVVAHPAVEQVGEQLWVSSLAGPAALFPLSYPPSARAISLRLVTHQLRHALARLEFTRPLLWIYWWFFPELIHQIPHTLSVYDIYDDHLEYDYIRGNARRVRYTHGLESRLLEQADVVFAVSRKLVDSKGNSKTVHYLPNGVDLSVAARAASLPAPDDLAGLPRPIVGYLGGYDSRLNWDLVEYLARSRPQWSFVFVGGGYTGPSREYANLHLVGNRPYPEAMRYVHSFDVALIPFVLDALTEAVCPAKLFDYLALGKPIVSTPLPAVDEITGTGGLVYRGRAPEEFLQMIERALREPDNPPAARRALAQSLTWEARTERAMSIVSAALSRDNRRPSGEAAAALL